MSTILSNAVKSCGIQVESGISESLESLLREQWIAVQECLETSAKTKCFDDLNSITGHLDTYISLLTKGPLARNEVVDKHLQLVTGMKELTRLLIEFCQVKNPVKKDDNEKLKIINDLMRDLGFTNNIPLPVNISTNENEKVEHVEKSTNTDDTQVPSNNNNNNNANASIKNENNSENASVPTVALSKNKKRSRNSRRRKSQANTANPTINDPSSSLTSQNSTDDDSSCSSSRVPSSQATTTITEQPKKQKNANFNKNESVASPSVAGTSTNKCSYIQNPHLWTKEDRRKVEAYRRFLDKKTRDIEQLKNLLRLVKCYNNISNKSGL